jgi:hypothetical protein
VAFSDIKHCVRNILMYTITPHEPCAVVRIPANLLIVEHLIVEHLIVVHQTLVVEVEQFVQVQPPTLTCQIRIARRRYQAAQ